MTNNAFVMAGHSRSNNGVASLAYGSRASRQGTPGACLSEMAGTSPAMTESMIQSETITR